MLRAFVLTCNHDTGWNVGDTNRTVGSVNVLTARPAGPVGINPQITFIDIDIDVIINLRNRSTEEKEVCLLALLSNGDILTKRWIPHSERR